jgi:hypothetical protein
MPMPYEMKASAKGRQKMPFGSQSNVVPYDKRTTSGRTSDIGLASGLIELRFMLVVSGVAGTLPALDIQIEGKLKSGSYAVLAKFDRVNDMTSQTLLLTMMPSIYRISWEISGSSPEFVFEVDSIYYVTF